MTLKKLLRFSAAVNAKVTTMYKSRRLDPLLRIRCDDGRIAVMTIPTIFRAPGRLKHSATYFHRKLYGSLHGS